MIRLLEFEPLSKLNDLKAFKIEENIFRNSQYA